jgi:hypothetical protein
MMPRIVISHANWIVDETTRRAAEDVRLHIPTDVK